MQAEEVDLVISADPENLPDVVFTSYLPMSPPLLQQRITRYRRDYVEAADFADQNVITYPVPLERLDLFSQLLLPAAIEPKSVRQVELTSVILLLVGANKGVSVLPDWVLQNSRETEHLTKKKLTRKALNKSSMQRCAP